MGMLWRQTVAMGLLVALPLTVAALTAIGLWRLDHSLQNVSEEYAEIRILHTVERETAAAILAIGSQDQKLHSEAHNYLKNAESALVQYLATQYDDIATEEHQAVESSEASAILKDLQDLLTPEGLRKSSGDQQVQLARIRQGLLQLHLAADTGVQEAQRSAHLVRRSTLWLVLAASILCAAVCIVLLSWASRSINQRLRELHKRLASHSPGSAPLTAKHLPGVVTQIEDLNARLIEKIEESGRELLRRERLVGIGLLAADVAHEINNPMNAMLGLSELGLRAIERSELDEMGKTELHDSLKVIRREALRCKAIVERLVAMVRADRKPSWFDATRLVQETVEVARAARPDRSQSFMVTGDSTSVSAFGPANDVRQILLNLLINAADAVGADGRIEADVTKTGNEVWFRVRDNGRGFTDDIKRKFFTPFVSHGDGKGAGLGLSIAQALAEGMGASLRPYSEGPGRGSMFILAIPTPKEGL